MKKVKTRKRPCRICRRWFMPNPRLKDRQKTCGNPQCKREWHRKMCKKWNRENSNSFKSSYLQKKLKAATTQGDKSLKITQPKSNFSALPKSRFKSGLPQMDVQEVIGIQHLIIIEYFAQLLYQRFQEVLARQVLVNTS